MKEASRPPLSPVSVAADLWGLFSVFRAAPRRRTKLFLYGFAFAFVACTGYLVFFSPPGSAASPWFGSFSASSSVSTAPYRSQISSLFSFIFPNSFSPSPENAAPLPEDPTVDLNRTAVGIGVAGNEVSEKDRTAAATAAAHADGVIGKNVTQNRGEEKKGAALASKNQTVTGSELQGNGVANSNHTEKIGNGISGKGGVDSDQKDTILSGKGQTGTGTADGVAKANQTEKGKNKVAAKDGAGYNSKDAILEAQNQTGTGTALQGNVDSASNRTEKVGNKIVATDAVGSPKDANLAAKNQTGVAASPKVDAKDAVGSPRIGDSAIDKNQTTSNGNQASGGAHKSSSTATPENGNAAKSNSNTPAVVSGTTKSNTLAGKNESTKATAAVPSSSSSPITKNEKKGEVSAKAKDSKSMTSIAASPSGGSDPKKMMDDLINGMKGCDIFHGTWVKDDSYPLYPEGSCPHIDEPFNCYLNGRPDRAYQKLRWQPSGCKIPRLNATDMLERLRGKRLVFVGDSLNRNMWESLVCILRNSVKDKKKVFEASGRREFRTVGSYSFIFKDYNCSVEFFRSPFLVQEWETPISNGNSKETLRLDIIEKSSPKYKGADVLVFNTGHWWTHEKTSKGKDYYQEGNHIYSELNVVNAFHKALNTWAKWVDNNVNSKKTLVVFRGYSASHFSGGQWNSGGQCDKETEPIKNEKYLSQYPPKMAILEEVIKGMKTPVSYLNITRMTDYRKDAHPSIYRKQKMTEEERRSPERYQDCSHWCLPGVPDSWNELLYAVLLIHQHQ